MIEISGEIKILLIGWVLGILSSIIEPFIITPIKKWRNKRNFKKNFKADIKIKKTELEDKKRSALRFAEVNTIDDAITKFTNPREILPSFMLTPKISIDFYNKNYETFLDGFDREIKFYQNILSLNLSIEGMEKVNDIRNPNLRLYLLLYWSDLKTALLEGEGISA